MVYKLAGASLGGVYIVASDDFAVSTEAFGLPVSTLRDWEQHRSTPDAPARALLRAIDREPETMRRLLSHAA